MPVTAEPPSGCACTGPELELELRQGRPLVGLLGRISRAGADPAPWLVELQFPLEPVLPGGAASCGQDGRV